jgi:Ca2+-binding EF-hand superfamily protein
MPLGIGNSLAGNEDLRATDAGIFKSADLNGDGKISRREIIHFTDIAFISIDANNDDVLTVEEFLQWDPGYVAIAEKRGKTTQLNAAKRNIYKEADLNGDGSLDHDEFSVASLYDFYKADVNHDRTLNQDEFISEYRILKVSRAAIE